MTIPHAATEVPGKGITIQAVFSRPHIDPLDAVEWALRRAEIKDEKGHVIWAQEGCEVPQAWSQLATDVVISKYAYGDPKKTLPDGRPEREHSVRQIMHRVCNPIANYGHAHNYFASTEDAETFRREIMTLCLEQYGSFNSPVWFNMGLQHIYGIAGPANNWIWDEATDSVIPCPDAYKHPQGSACFIQSVDDDMYSIMALATSEAILFKFGSGTGTDLSTLRSSRETVAGGGRASGPVSFMRIYDATASVVKSGGKTRRAAKMQTLKCHHPDILEFIESKAKEEKKAQALIQAGYEANFNGEAYSSVMFQNCNMSVRVTDRFLRLASGIAPAPGPADHDWQTQSVMDGRTAGMPSYNACQLLDKVAEGTWLCGDPGMQYEDTIQRWHTCPNTAPINSSNPCCFVGETLMDTSEGRIQLSELAAMSLQGQPLPLAFGFDKKTGLPVLKPIERVWISGRTTDLVEVVTDQGLVFRCTPHHVWLLRDGQEVNAANLKPGDRLRKIGRSEIHDRGFRKYINHKVTSGCPHGSEYQARWMWEQAYGPIPEGMEVHHKDGDCTNDKLSNFELKPTVAHRSDHARGPANSNYMEDVTDNQLVEIWEAIETLPKQTHKNGPPVTPARWNAYVKAHGLSGKAPLAGSPTTGGKIRGMSWAEFTNWIEESRGAVNDSIQFVRAVHLNHAVPVYDASIPAVRNFAIGSDRSRHSIVVHNSEYMFIDDSACNLASVNLMKFRRENGTIDDVRLRAASHIMITAQEILVDMGSYPTAKIAENSHRFRPLGLGFCNLGSLLMACGAPYDSDRGRSLAACVTAILHGQAYATSADHAWHKGPFAGFAENRAPMLRVIRKHQEAVEDIDDCDDPEIIRLKTVARGLWKEVVAAGETHGFRNSQVTVIAPTGTIAFMMDADTTGIEPDVALVKYKNLAGRGQLKIVNQTVPLALKTLGYSEESIRTIWAYMERHDTIEGCPALRDSDLAVFDCAFKPLNGRRSIAWDGHVRMMAAVQPFVSGAISKTVNMDREATIDDIRKAYLLGWKLGLKALAIYRDGSKWSQPVGMSSDHGNEVTATAWTETEAGRAFLQIQGHLTDFLGNTPALYEIETVMASVLAKAREAGRPVRRKLPKSRDALHHRFEIRAAQGPAEGYIGVGFYPGTRTPGEIFITMSKEGSTVSGLMDILATLVSIGLQYGVPLDVFVKKFAYTRFEPSGLTDNHEIPLAYSVADYIFRWLGMEFIPGYREENQPKHADAIRGIRADSVLPEGPYDLDPARFLVPEVYDQVINGFSHGNGDRALSLLKGTVKTPPRVEEPRRGSQRAVATQALTGPECARCKSIMVPAGPCYRCIVCGNDVGGCG